MRNVMRDDYRVAIVSRIIQKYNIRRVENKGLILKTEIVIIMIQSGARTYNHCPNNESKKGRYLRI